MIQRTATNGMRVFNIIWVGQLVSLVGTGLFNFAVGVWVYRQTGSATLFVLISLCSNLPGMVVAPLAGAIVDRSDRRWAMILGDSGSALCTLAIAWLVWSGIPAIWPLYLALAASSISNAFQWPAYEASVALLVPKDQLGRVNGMVQLSEAISVVAPPVLAGALIVLIGIWGVVLVDVVTFVFSVATLLIVHIPRPEPTGQGREQQGSLLRETIYGWTYIQARQGLLALLILFSVLNFLVGTLGELSTPLILSFASETTLGTVLSIAGIGMVVGGLVMSRWGGPKRRIHGVLGFTLIGGLFVLLSGMRPSAPLVAVGLFGFLVCMPIINASSQAIWQSKVALDVQGRVFAVRRTVAQLTQPVALIIAGPLIDYAFDPLLVANGPLAGSVGRVIGAGPGRGIGLLFIILGVSAAAVSALGYLYRPLRRVEDELEDSLPASLEVGVTASEP